MLLSDVIERVNFNVATQMDLSGKAVGSLFTNRQIIMNLKTALDKYASHTRAIEGLYSFPLDSSNLATINEPPLALRSRSYRFAVMYIGGVAFPLALHDLNDTYGNFPVQTQGLPTWGLAWQKMIYMFPQSGYTNNSTILSNDIGASDTTINVANAKSFPVKNGRFSVGNETIFYGSRTDTQFKNCIRGSEGTTAANHSNGNAVKENNVWIYYYKRHFEITVDSSDNISTADLAKEMEVYDEHLEIIIDYCSYKLLSKVDAQRAASYMNNFDKWLDNARDDIDAGRQDISQVGEIRSKYWFENNSPFGMGGY